MLNISRFDPFAEISRLDPLADDLLRSFTLRPLVRTTELDYQIRVDVAEDESSYRVWADIPGVKKEDIKVSIDGNQVSITAEAKREDGDSKKFVRRERYSGTMSRSFGLAHDVNDKDARARYSDGVLDMVLPKAVAGRARSISVS